MDISEVKKKLAEISLKLEVSRIPENIQVLEVSDVNNVENLYKLATVIYKHKNTNKTYSQLIWSEPLRCVVTPIIIKNGQDYYFLLAGQSRAPFSGKLAIEVYRGFINDERLSDNSKLWKSLLGRKLPYITDISRIVKTVELANPFQHPDYTPDSMPIQLVFLQTYQYVDIAELKKALKTKHDYANEPRYGPPLHNNGPIIKSISEIENRLEEIQLSPAVTDSEFYINDLASYIAINKTLNYINNFGFPYD